MGSLGVLVKTASMNIGKVRACLDKSGRDEALEHVATRPAAEREMPQTQTEPRTTAQSKSPHDVPCSKATCAAADTVSLPAQPSSISRHSQVFAAVVGPQHHAVRTRSCVVVQLWPCQQKTLAHPTEKRWCMGCVLERKPTYVGATGATASITRQVTELQHVKYAAKCHLSINCVVALSMSTCQAGLL